MDSLQIAYRPSIEREAAPGALYLGPRKVRQLTGNRTHLRGCVADYARWVHLIAAMLCGGFTADETAKIAGGNYLRIFRCSGLRKKD